jgi:hypothetical protein
MYKNFNLSEEEKKQILEQHKSHGYKKPISEQEEEGDSPTRELIVNELAYASITRYNIDVKINNDYNNEPVELIVTLGPYGDIIDIKIRSNYDKVISDEEAIAFIKQKSEEGYFEGLPLRMSWDIEKKEPFDFE